MKEVQVGPFKAPGLAFQPGQISNESLELMKAWATTPKQGMFLSEKLWAFKTPAARTSFILKWNDHIKRIEDVEG